MAVEPRGFDILLQGIALLSNTSGPNGNGTNNITTVTAGITTTLRRLLGTKFDLMLHLFNFSYQIMGTGISPVQKLGLTVPAFLLLFSLLRWLWLTVVESLINGYFTSSVEISSQDHIYTQFKTFLGVEEMVKSRHLTAETAWD